jgi:hypothetical protein
MDLQNIIVVAIVALVAMFLLPKLGIGRRGGTSPMDPPGSGGGRGLFPTAPGNPDEPDRPGPVRDQPGRVDNDFADRVEGKGPEKKT